MTSPLLARSGSPPHVIPYQGSKRALAPVLLALLRERLAGRPVRRLYEPFAGSAALSLAAAHQRVAQAHIVADAYPPLMALWRRVVSEPQALASDYAELWRQCDYHAVRAAFNREPRPAALLYLLTRCVKAAVRFNRQGEFNQAPDRRRRGTQPERMQRQIHAAAALLQARCELRLGDALATTGDAGPGDVCYLDPPWHGTSVGRDSRYASGYSAAALEQLVAQLHGRGVLVLLSYDGERAGRDFARPLPDSLERIRLPAQRSAQATLLGREEWTAESLYVTRQAAPAPLAG